MREEKGEVMSGLWRVVVELAPEMLGRKCCCSLWCFEKYDASAVRDGCLSMNYYGVKYERNSNNCKEAMVG